MKMKSVKAKYYLIPAAACLLAILALTYYYFFTSFSEKQETSYIYIDNDDTPDSVYHKLQPVAHRHSLAAFSLLSRHLNYGKHMHPGRYAVKPGVSSVQLFRSIKNGQQAPLRLTIPEARTMERLSALLGDKLMIDSTELADCLLDSAFCSRYGYTTQTIPSLFVPDTYEVYWTVSVEQLIKRMQHEHDNFWEGERSQKAGNLGLSPNEVCTLASIIDEETSNNEEKPMIAGMYLNRLKANMPLQADPTVKFALHHFELRRIYHDMLTFDSPYNTYRNTGLPPGPIKIASKKGIDAVLNRTEHDYLYMCAKEDFSGTHNFAHSYQEHLQNAARYAKALNARGIR